MKTTDTPTTTEDAPGVVVHSISISNVLGIRELKLDVPPGGAVFAGPNGSGKTSAIEAIRMALTGQGVSPKAIRRGSTKGEIFLDLSHPSVGTRFVTRSISLKKGGALEVSGPDGVPLPAPQGILTRLLGAAPLCPLALWKAPAKEQRALILSAMPAPVTAGMIKTWCAETNPSRGFIAALLGGAAVGEDDAPIEGRGHGLEILASVRKYFYDHRTKANEHAREKEATAQQARQRLEDAVETFGPGEVLSVEDTAQALYDAERAKRVAVQTNAAADAWRDRVAATQFRIAGLRGSVDLEAHPLPVAPSEEELDEATAAVERAEVHVERAESRVAELEKMLSEAKANADARRADRALAFNARKDVDSRRAVALAAVARRAATIEQADALETGIGAPPARVDAETLATLDAAVPAAEKALARARGAVALNTVREDVATAETAATAARDGAASLNTIVKRLTDEAPGQLFNAATAIPGLTVTEDSFELDGVDIANLSGKEKLFFCTTAIKRLSKGKILFVELEALQPSLIPEFLAHATKDGFQVFATRIEGAYGGCVVEPIGTEEVVEVSTS